MKKIRWGIVAVVGISLLAWILASQAKDIVTGIRERPMLLKKVEKLERERDSLMVELWVMEVELSRMARTVDESLTEEEQEEFWKWMSTETE